MFSSLHHLVLMLHFEQDRRLESRVKASLMLRSTPLAVQFANHGTSTAFQGPQSSNTSGDDPDRKSGLHVHREQEALPIFSSQSSCHEASLFLLVRHETVYGLRFATKILVSLIWTADFL